MRRRHRWIRGDWQIASWLFRRVPGVAGRRERNPLSVLSQWKILDNLRRSLVPPALTLLLVLGWTVLSPAAFWTLAVLGIMAIPALCASAAGIAVEVSRLALEPAPAGGAECRRAAAAANAVRTRLPPLRGVRQSRRDRAHDVAHARDSPAIAAMDPFERPRAEQPSRSRGYVAGRCGSLRRLRWRSSSRS